MTKNRQFNMNVDQDFLNRLQHMCEAVGCSRAEIINQMIPSEAVVDALVEDCKHYSTDVKLIPKKFQETIVLELRDRMCIPGMRYNLDYQVRVVQKLSGLEAVAKLYTAWIRALKKVPGYIFGFVGDPTGETAETAWSVKSPDVTEQYMVLIQQGMIVKMRETQRIIDSLKFSAKT